MYFERRPGLDGRVRRVTAASPRRAEGERQPRRSPPRGPEHRAEAQRRAHGPESNRDQPEVVRNPRSDSWIVQQRRHVQLHDEQLVSERVRAIARQLAKELLDAVVDDQPVVEHDHATITRRAAAETRISQSGSIRMLGVDQAEVGSEIGVVYVFGGAIDRGQLVQIRTRHTREPLEHPRRRVVRIGDSASRPPVWRNGVAPVDRDDAPTARIDDERLQAGAVVRANLQVAELAPGSERRVHGEQRSAIGRRRTGPFNLVEQRQVETIDATARRH